MTLERFEQTTSEVIPSLTRTPRVGSTGLADGFSRSSKPPVIQIFSQSASSNKRLETISAEISQMSVVTQGFVGVSASCPGHDAHPPSLRERRPNRGRRVLPLVVACIAQGSPSLADSAASRPPRMHRKQGALKSRNRTGKESGRSGRFPLKREASLRWKQTVPATRSCRPLCPSRLTRGDPAPPNPIPAQRPQQPGNGEQKTPSR